MSINRYLEETASKLIIKGNEKESIALFDISSIYFLKFSEFSGFGTDVFASTRNILLLSFKINSTDFIC